MDNELKKLLEKAKTEAERVDIMDKFLLKKIKKVCINFPL